MESVINRRAPKGNFIHDADGVGVQYYNQRMDGLIASFHLGLEKSHLAGSIAFTDGFYQEDDPKISAEIIMLMPPHPIDVTEGVGISEYTKRKLRPNFDWNKGAACWRRILLCSKRGRGGTVQLILRE